MSFRELNFFFLSALFALFSTTCAQRKNRCVTLYESNPEYFDVCKTTECFVFRTEIPFVFIPDTMNSTEHQRPFPCSKYNQQFKNLHGPFFDIVNSTQTLRDAQCVWGGSECHFDDMVNFVKRSTTPEGYKFIAGGLLFMLEYRMSNSTIASAPMLDDLLTIIGPRDNDATTWGRAWETMWRPFSRRAWVLLWMTAISVVIMRLWISYHFTVPFSWAQFRDNFLGDYMHSDVYMTASQGRSRSRAARFRDPAELRRLNTYLSNGSKIVFVIVILYYEISIVNFVFSEHHEKMDHFRPEQFVITRNTTMNKKFKDYINGKDFRNCPEENCWLEVDSIQGVYDTITSQNDTKSPVYRYSAVYETLNRYWFTKNQSLCTELQVLDYPPLNRRFAGVWYYSSNIPPARRTEIDIAIVKLRELDMIRAFVHKVTGAELPAKCKKSDNIDYLQLGMPLFIFAGPIFSAVFFYMVLYTIRWRNLIEDDDNHESDDESDFDVVIDDGSGGGGGGRTRAMSFRNFDNSEPPSMSQISISTSSQSAELLAELLETMRIRAQISRPTSVNRRRT